MEKFNLNFSGGDNVIKSICWIFSVLSWLLLIVTGWISIRWLDDDTLGKIVWTIIRIGKGEQSYFYVNDLDHVPYEPLQMHEALIYTVFILTMIIALAGFIIYMIKSTCKKDDAVFNGMMGQWSKFHFFPLLCISAMFIVGENFDNPIKEEDHLKGMRVSAFVFDILGLCSLIFIYIMTDLNSDWYVLLTLKKGTYSCFITLLWYYFCYAIYYLRELDQTEQTKDLKLYDWSKGCGIAFSIIFGIGSLIFAYIFKDLVVCGMNLLIYLGLTIYYFQIPHAIRNSEFANKYGDGIVDIIMMVLSIAEIVVLLITKKEECLKS
jgi:hypothetical protein